MIQNSDAKWTYQTGRCTCPMGMVEPSITPKTMVGHLHLLKDLHGEDVKAGPSIDEGTIDGDVVNVQRAHDRYGAPGPSGDQVVLCIEGDLVGGPFQPWSVSAWLCCHDFA
jgi:hypothetical protein